MIKSFECDIVGFVITSLGVKIICASNIVMLFCMGWKISIRGLWKNIIHKHNMRNKLSGNMINKLVSVSDITWINCDVNTNRSLIITIRKAND